MIRQNESVKKTILCALGILASGILYFSLSGHAAESTTDHPAPATPRVGRPVEIQLIAWPMATVEVAKIQGTLVAMADGWIILKSGSQETWLPREKVLTMKVDF